MGRPSNTQQRKQEIVDALLRVMAVHGYEKASIQVIAKEAGLAPGLIHYHFKTKQDILLALINWIATSASDRLEKLNSMDKDPWHKLEAFINARLATGDTQMPEVVSAWVVIAGESLKQPEIKEIYQDLIGQQLTLLRQLLADVWDGKSSKNKEVIHLSATVMAAMEGAFQLSATAHDVMPKNYAAESILELIKNRVGL
ncbi:hypothetical protein A3715_13530 [Oleiphilus sp. HI0009]|nr:MULTISPECIES: TetR/AcrR family transcriptional regulator [unclassified Oleiphilus]KZX76143.1 hypothetical protein A3715_13530 [Oleiphilus sp. HI0009]KZY67942.1 hypothetical protein A3739_11480 [Oleiphilus sp. HI0067]KZY71701.1 hypothetical protein A3738_03300 [Oleiphilus sp. HI0066]